MSVRVSNTKSSVGGAEGETDEEGLVEAEGDRDADGEDEGDNEALGETDALGDTLGDSDDDGLPAATPASERISTPPHRVGEAVDNVNEAEATVLPALKD